GNAAGDWVVGGYTSAQRYALAVNAARVVWRQGDPIDLDADGSYDDGLLFAAPTELGRAGLTDDGRLFLVNELTDATGVLARIGFFLVDATRGHLGTSYCDPAAANSTGFWAHLDAIGSPVVQAGDVALTAWRIPNGQFGYFLVSRDPGAFMPPGSAGLLCLSGNIGRYNRLTELIQGPSGVLSIDLGSVPVNPAAAVVPGDVWRFQCWYRDVGASSNFTNALEIAFQ
ncbi:MAG: hypothetical protein GY711_11270, partial [bacterium]|nr:hypothetical protein [bacterium]